MNLFNKKKKPDTVNQTVININITNTYYFDNTRKFRFTKDEVAGFMIGTFLFISFWVAVIICSLPKK